MDYKVIISAAALANLDHIIDYVKNTLDNAQAALSILADAELTKDRLSQIAGSLKQNEHFKQNYRTIRFKHHKFLMVYKIQGSEAHVLGIFHASQDYINYLNSLPETASETNPEISQKINPKTTPNS